MCFSFVLLFDEGISGMVIGVVWTANLYQSGQMMILRGNLACRSVPSE